MFILYCIYLPPLTCAVTARTSAVVLLHRCMLPLHSPPSPAEVLCSFSIASNILRRCVLSPQEHRSSPPPPIYAVIVYSVAPYHLQARGLHSNLFRVGRIAWLPDIDCIHLSLPMYASLYSTPSPAEVLCSSSIASILLRRCMLALQEHILSTVEVLCSSSIPLPRIIYKHPSDIRISFEREKSMAV